MWKTKYETNKSDCVVIENFHKRYNIKVEINENMKWMTNAKNNLMERNAPKKHRSIGYTSKITISDSYNKYFQIIKITTCKMFC